MRRPEPGDLTLRGRNSSIHVLAGPCGLPATSLPTPAGVAPACPRPLACPWLLVVSQVEPEQVERSHSSSGELQNLILLVNVAWQQERPDRSPVSWLTSRVLPVVREKPEPGPRLLLSPSGLSPLPSKSAECELPLCPGSSCPLTSLDLLGSVRMRWEQRPERAGSWSVASQLGQSQHFLPKASTAQGLPSLQQGLSVQR